jgi:CheY-like chemotaxis protein
MIILGIDEDPVLLELTTEYFEDLGHTFLACRSQMEAQPLLTAHRFDAVVVDYHLERGGGKLLIASILRSHPRVRLVVVSGDHNPETEREVRAMGVQNLLYKPFRFRKLMGLVSPRESGKTGPRLTIYGEVAEDELGALKSVLMEDPRNDQAKWLLAFGYYRAGKYANAGHLFRELLREDGDNKLALYYLGASQYRFGVYEDAVRSWKHIVELDPKGPLSKKAREHILHAQELIVSS